jgi:regulator of protease activity HflC (stomatin/prohibitin superfamily)
MSAFLAIAVLIFALLISGGLHQVREGFVGVYWRGGALLKGVSYPGFHVKIPLVTRFEEMQVTVQVFIFLHCKEGRKEGRKVEVYMRPRTNSCRK